MNNINNKYKLMLKNKQMIQKKQMRYIKMLNKVYRKLSVWQNKF
jgi:hypothetical protein